MGEEILSDEEIEKLLAAPYSEQSASGSSQKKIPAFSQADFTELISRICDKSLQLVIQKTDLKVLAAALTGSDVKGILEKIYRNISKNHSEVLQQEIKYAQTSSEMDRESARLEIVRLIYTLDESGEIIISRSS